MDYLKILSSKYGMIEERTRYGATILKSNDLYIQLIEPHHWTEFQYCLKAEFPETIDKCDVTTFEEYFVSDGGFRQTLEALELFIKDKIIVDNENH